MVLRGNIKPYFNQIVINKTLEEMSFAEKKNVVIRLLLLLIKWRWLNTRFLINLTISISMNKNRKCSGCIIFVSTKDGGSLDLLLYSVLTRSVF